MSARLSSRSQHARSSQSGENLVWEVCADLWDPKTNPNGYVSLGMAENSLMHKELRDFISNMNLVDVQSKALTYGDGPSGSKAVRSALANFINDYFHPFADISPEQLVVTNGVSSAIEHASWTIADPNEGILVGRPYYRAFIMDIELRPGVKVVPVSFDEVDPCGPQCVEKYEKALLASDLRGVKIRAILICHPHNPLGRCYTRETLMSLMKLCDKYNIHLLSDEIYGLSTWHNTVEGLNEDDSEFSSVLSMPTDGIISADLVHVLWGTSKDFGANGIRLGVVISPANPDFLATCRSCAIFSSPSSLTEIAVANILSNRPFLDTYITMNKRRLSEAYSYAVQRLNRHGIEYMGGTTAAFFLWVNLGKFLLEIHGKEDGRAVDTGKIFSTLFQERVFIVSGDAAGAEHGGWFRLVFSQRRELVDETIERIVHALRR